MCTIPLHIEANVIYDNTTNSTAWGDGSWQPSGQCSIAVSKTVTVQSLEFPITSIDVYPSLLYPSTNFLKRTHCAVSIIYNDNSPNTNGFSVFAILLYIAVAVGLLA